MPTHETTDHRGAASGYAPLGTDSKVPPANVPSAIHVAQFAPVADCVVQADGTIRDLVSGTLATITGNSGVVPNLRAWSTVKSGGAGYCGDFTNAAVVTIPVTTGLSVATGSIAVVCAPAHPGDGTRCAAMLKNAAAVVVELWGNYGSAATLGSDGGATVESLVANTPTVIGMTWATNSLIAYKDGAAGTPDTSVTAPVDPPTAAWVGSASGTSAFWNGPIQRAVFYDFVLTPAQWIRLNYLLNGPVILPLVSV
jgi:hypothetical protein